MKTMIIMMILSVVYLVVMDVVNKKLESIDFNDNITSSYVEEDSSYYSVSVSGAVTNPGTYTVYKGANLGYLITLAGGLEEDADNSAFKLDTILVNNTNYYIARISNKEEVKVSINEANIALLDTLPGIGTVLAKRIVSYRSSNGLFNSIEDIKNVSGIGDSLFEQIKDFICL